MGFQRIIHRKRNKRQGSLVKHIIHALECQCQAGAVLNICLKKLHFVPGIREILNVPGGEIVQSADGFPPFRQFARNGRANESGCAGYQE